MNIFTFWYLNHSFYDLSSCFYNLWTITMS